MRAPNPRLPLLSLTLPHPIFINGSGTGGAVEAWRSPCSLIGESMITALLKKGTADKWRFWFCSYLSCHNN